MTELRERLFRDGLIAGVVAYGVVALYFLLLNVFMGRPPLYTAMLLGEALFGGLRDPGLMTMDMGLAIAFNGVQLLVLLVYGYFAAWLVYETELHPPVWYLAMFAFLAGTVAGYAGLLVVTLLLGHIVSPWLAAGSSLLSAASVVLYFVLSHRPLARAIPGEAPEAAGVHHGG